MIPKKLNKMSFAEQERYLVKKLNEIYMKEKIYRIALAKVRSKQSVNLTEIDRPDLYELKAED